MLWKSLPKLNYCIQSKMIKTTTWIREVGLKEWTEHTENTILNLLNMYRVYKRDYLKGIKDLWDKKPHVLDNFLLTFYSVCHFCREIMLKYAWQNKRQNHGTWLWWSKDVCFHWLMRSSSSFCVLSKVWGLFFPLILQRLILLL